MSRTLKRKPVEAAAPFRKIRKTSSSAEEGESDESDEFRGFSSSSEAEIGAEEPSVTVTKSFTNGTAVSKPPQAVATPELDAWAKADLVKLQIDALLANVHPDEAKRQPLDDLLQAVESALKGAASIAATSVPDAVAQLRKRGVAVPFAKPEPAKDVQWKLAFEPPVRVEQVGSWPLDSVCAWKGRDGCAADIAVFMPNSLLQANDHKDHRYLHKRAYFLACLAAALKTSPLGKKVELSFGYLHGDARKPTLELRPMEGSKYDVGELRCFVRLLPVFDLETSPLKLARLGPAKDNVGDEEASQSSSPSYNASILIDGLIPLHHAFLAKTSEGVPHFAEACQLLKVWAHQRAIGEHAEHRSEAGLHGAGYLLSMILAHLVAKGEKGGSRLPQRADAWQLFRGCLEWIGQGEFLKKSIAMRRHSTLAVAFEAKDFVTADRAVMVDPCGLANLLQDVPRSSLEYVRPLLCLHWQPDPSDAQLCHLARMTARSLAGNSLDGFEDALTRSQHAPHLQFDVTAQLKLSTTWLDQRFEASDAPSRVNAALASLSSLLKRALGTRIVCLSLSHVARSRRPLDKPSADCIETVTVGLLLNAEEAGRLVDYGPAADNVEAAEDFKRFWGEKSELRRFKDGRILESVVWTADTPLARGSIVGQILRYMLCDSPHFALNSSEVSIFCSAFDDLLTDALLPNDKGFATVQTAYDSLSKTLRGLEDLPLTISSIAASSEALRYSSVFVPQAMPQAARLPAVCRYVPVMDVHLTFESSSRWPDDLEAIQKIKAAILVSIGEKLRAVKDEAARIVRVEVAFEPNASAQADNVSLELLTESGFAFRLRVHYEGEEQQIRAQMLSSKGTTKADLYAHLLSLHSKRFEARPRHHAAIAALQHRHASFSGAVRLFKRWLSAHMLSPHISAEAAELLVAHVYLCAGAQSAPASVATGFARTLDLLSRWNWRTSPLITPLYSAVDDDAEAIAVRGRIDFPADKAAEAKKLFETTRKADPQIRRGALLLVTERDLSGREWTWRTPNRIIAVRLVEVAKATLAALDAGLQRGDLDPRILFSTSLEAYDFLVHLDPAQLPRYSQAVNADPDVLRNSSTAKSPALLGFDPAAILLDRLQSFFGDTALLFHDLNGGSVIAGVFDPALAKARDYRVHLDFACKPEGDDSPARVTLDRSAMLAGVRRIGGSLVQRIELH